MSFDLAGLRAAVGRHGRVARVVVAEARGSAPRESGAAMIVWQGGQEGTIGGGALEWQAAARARAMLAAAEPGPAAPPTPIPSPRGGGEAPGAAVDRLALGPALQQCCGGAVILLTEVFDAGRIGALRLEAGLVVRPVAGGAEMPLAVRRRLAAARGQGATGGPVLAEGWAVEPLEQPLRQLWVWGAGHVGRALVAVLAPLPGLAVTWVDTATERFPAAVPDGVETVVAADPALLAARAPAEADHLILTHSHALDLALCHALLARGFRRCGLIGSATKRARFRKRLVELGHPPAAIARIDCPIGEPALGKHPQAIAISVAAAILRDQSAARSAKDGAG
jgi:xanthine dehydrogenase accessory factor